MEMKDIAKRNFIDDGTIEEGKPQRNFIEEISERVAGYMGGTQYALREWSLNKTEQFNRQANAFIGEAEVTLELRIDIMREEE